MRYSTGSDAGKHAGAVAGSGKVVAMIQIGKIVLLLWAIGLGYVGLLLVMGQGAVAMTAIEAGRLSEAIMQGIFITIVFVCTAIAVGLFLFVGVLRE